MSTRVLVTLEPDTDAADVADALSGLGALEVTPPRPELPDVLVATVDDQQHPATDFAAAAQRLPGVAGAEVDQLRWSM